MMFIDSKNDVYRYPELGLQEQEELFWRKLNVASSPNAPFGLNLSAIAYAYDFLRCIVPWRPP